MVHSVTELKYMQKCVICVRCTKMSSVKMCDSYVGIRGHVKLLDYRNTASILVGV